MLKRSIWNAKEQHKDLCNILQGASVTLHIIFLGVGGTIYNTHTLKPFKELGLDSQRVKKLASKLHVHSVNFAAKLVHTRHAFSSTVINSHQEPVSGQACNPLDLHWFSFPFHGGGALRYLARGGGALRYQSGSFSLIYVGSGFHCLRSFSFLFMSRRIMYQLKHGLQVWAISPPSPPKVFLTSPPSSREKEATAQATHWGDG